MFPLCEGNSKFRNDKGNKIMKRTVLISLILLCTAAVSAGGNKDTVEQPAVQASFTIEDAAADLGVTSNELKAALGDPNAGPPNIAGAAVTLGIEETILQAVFNKMTPLEAEQAEVEQYTLVLNGIEIDTTYPTWGWEDLPSDVQVTRNPVKAYTDEEGTTHYYEPIFVGSGNLNWYQAAALAEDAGGYLACLESAGENDFVFSLINDDTYFWHFEENGEHYGISIGPFLGGYQPEGSPEPDGGWIWLSGNEWDYTNWAQDLNDGVTDKDPRNNTQPNNSGTGQPIMGFGEMNIPVPTWGDYMEAVGAYGLTRSPGKNYGFIIEYEHDPR